MIITRNTQWKYVHETKHNYEAGRTFANETESGKASKRAVLLDSEH